MLIGRLISNCSHNFTFFLFILLHSTSVPVDVAHHAPEPGTELSIPEKYGCSIDSKFYPEGAQVPSNPNKPCELCYCIKNRTSCLMQECTLHIDGCTPIYNKGSCCPVRYNCGKLVKISRENKMLMLY